MYWHKYDKYCVPGQTEKILFVCNCYLGLLLYKYYLFITVNLVPIDWKRIDLLILAHISGYIVILFNNEMFYYRWKSSANAVHS